MSESSEFESHLSEGRKLRDSGHYAEAREEYALALRAVEACGLGRTAFMRVANELGAVSRSLGKLGEAESLLRRAIELGKGVDSEPGLLASCMINLSEVLVDRCQYDEAESLIADALELDRMVFGAEHRRVATDLRKLAALAGLRGDLELAEHYATRALRVAQALNDMSLIEASMNDLGAVLRELGRLKEAIALLEAAERIARNELSEGHPEIATRMLNLAGAYKEDERYEEAESLYLEALSIRERGCGAESPPVAQVLNNLATLYIEVGRLDDAQALLLSALSIREAALGPCHEHIASTAYNLASLYRDMGRHAEALRHARRALEIHEELLPDAAATMLIRDFSAQLAEELDQADPHDNG